MPRLKTETLHSGDQSWLGSTHAIADGRTELLDISTFTAGTHYPDGFIKSGTPVAKVGGVLVPYDSTEGVTTNAGVLAGHLLTDQQVVGTNDFAVPIIDHGRVITSKVPQGANAFTAPIAAAKKAAVTIVYI